MPPELGVTIALAPQRSTASMEAGPIFAAIMTNWSAASRKSPWRVAACASWPHQDSLSKAVQRRKVAGSTDLIVLAITTKLRALRLRRAVAAACALAFLLIGFCHTLQHANAAVPSIALQATLSDGSDATPDIPGKIDISADHCHGCVMLAMPVVADATLLFRIKLVFPAARSAGLHPYFPIAETPPPIFTI